MIRLENVDAEEFFAGQNVNDGTDNADNTNIDEDAGEDEFDDEDLGIDEEGVVDAQKALLSGIFRKNKKKRQENNQTAAQQREAHNDSKLNAEQPGSSNPSKAVTEESEAEIEEAEAEEACMDGLNEETPTPRKKSRQEDMLNRFGKPKRVYMFCYDDEEAL